MKYCCYKLFEGHKIQIFQALKKKIIMRLRYLKNYEPIQTNFDPRQAKMTCM